MLGKLLRRDQGLSTVAPGSALYAALTGDAGGLGPTYAGPTVNSDTALRIGAVLACVRLIAETIGSLPRKVYRRNDDGRSELRLPADKHLWGLPNGEQLGQFVWTNVIAHLLLTGNAYLYTPRNDLGAITEFWPLNPLRVTTFRDMGSTNAVGLHPLRHAIDGQVLPAEALLHIPGFGTDGVKGLSVISYARQALGATLATEEFGARFFGQGTALSGILTTDQKLDPPQIERLKANWNAAHKGRQNAHKTAILEGGLKWTAVSVAPADAQYLEVRKFQRAEIASLFRVPPHLIGDVERSTSWGTGIEQQNIQFITYTLLPWLTLVEEAITEKLLPQENRYFRFSLAGLLRGTLQERYTAYRLGREGGWLSVNDIRRLEDLPPIAEGNDYLQPLNYAPLGSLAAQGGTNDPTQP